MPSRSDTAPVMVATDSPEFRDAVAAAVANALAGAGVPVLTDLGTAPGPQTVALTSIDLTQPGLDDLTVRFRRFCTFQGAGYQRDQEAGFPRVAAEALASSGAAFIVHDPRRFR